MRTITTKQSYLIITLSLIVVVGVGGVWWSRNNATKEMVENKETGKIAQNEKREQTEQGGRTEQRGQETDTQEQVPGIIYTEDGTIDTSDVSSSGITYLPDGTIDTSDWLTYRNEEYGFSFMYPRGWYLGEPSKPFNKEEYDKADGHIAVGTYEYNLLQNEKDVANFEVRFTREYVDFLFNQNFFEKQFGNILFNDGYYFSLWGDIDREITIAKKESKNMLIINFSIPYAIPFTRVEDPTRERINQLRTNLESGIYPNQFVADYITIIDKILSTLNFFPIP